MAGGNGASRVAIVAGLRTPFAKQSTAYRTMSALDPITSYNVCYTKLLRFDQADQMDEWQGVRADGSGPYFLFPVLAVDLQGVSHAALLYRKDMQGDPTSPSDGQRDFIVAAARAQGVPETYIEGLSGLPVTKAKS